MPTRLNSNITERTQDITGNVTINTPDVPVGTTVIYLLDQDATGNHDISFDSQFVFPNNVTLPLSSPASTRRVVRFLKGSISLYYEVDFETNIPVSAPIDYISYFPLNNVGTDTQNYFTGDAGTSGAPNNPVYATLGVSATGLEQNLAQNTNVVLNTIASFAAADNLHRDVTVSFWSEIGGGAGGFVTLKSADSVSSNNYFSDQVIISPSQVNQTSFWYNSSTSSSTSSSLVHNNSDSIKHFIFTRTDNGAGNYTKTLYLNGVQVGTQTSGALPLSNVTNLGNFKIRNITFGFSNINFRMDDIQVFDRAITSQEAQAIFNQNKADYGL